MIFLFFLYVLFPTMWAYALLTNASATGAAHILTPNIFYVHPHQDNDVGNE